MSPRAKIPEGAVVFGVPSTEDSFTNSGIAKIEDVFNSWLAQGAKSDSMLTLAQILDALFKI